MADELNDLPPELVKALMLLGAQSQEQQGMQEKLAQARSLQNRGYTGGGAWGGALSGLTSAMGGLQGALQNKKSQELAKQQAATREQFLMNLLKKNSPQDPTQQKGLAAPIGTGEAGTDGWGY